MGTIKMVEVTRSDFIESIHYEKTISIRVSGFDVSDIKAVFKGAMELCLE